MNHLYQTAIQSLKLMDLTQLNEDDSPQDIISLCQKAKSNFGNTAAICIYPYFIPIAKRQLRQQQTPEINIVTVVNFPEGDNSISSVVNEISHAIKYGADEIDVVFPYKALMRGDENAGFELIKQCKAACGDTFLKVIIESGELKSKELIKKATQVAIKAGANMIKTSTGKVPINATLEAAEIILTVIDEMKDQYTVGFKASGGINTLEDSSAYLNLAEDILGTNNLHKNSFRIGASSLLNNLIHNLDSMPPNTEAKKH